LYFLNRKLEIQAAIIGEISTSNITSHPTNPLSVKLKSIFRKLFLILALNRDPIMIISQTMKIKAA